MLYLFWFVHLVFGALTDSRMWGKKEDDPHWLAEYTDVFWLGYYTLCPFWIAYIGWELISIESILIGFGMSVFWDLAYSKIEFGKWIVPLPLWLLIPNPFSKGKIWYERRIVIGFDTVERVRDFNLFRILIILLTIIF
jgi:hypothetical protein